MVHPTSAELNALLDYGWSLHPTMLDVFLKDYETICGIKTAQIVIYNEVKDDDVINYKFKAEYFSEGRNVLASTSYYHGRFEHYLAQIDQRINESYARRLVL